MQSTVAFTVDVKTREQATYEALRGAIIEGRWGPGEPLVGSRIADQLRVSRITVANALKRLSGEGFVQLTPHKGAVVARLDPYDVREVYLMRAELEGLAVREAARWITPDDLAELHALNMEIGRLRVRNADIREVRQVDLAFHRRLREVAQMPLLAQTLQNLADQCEGYRARLLDQRPRMVPSPERHAPLLGALQAREGPTAGECMREHVFGGMHAVLANLETDEGPLRGRQEGLPQVALEAGLGDA